MSKATALHELRQIESAAFVIDPFVEFTFDKWEADPTTVLRTLREAGLGDKVAVRSSASHEVIAQSTPPGLFLTVLDVDLFNSLDIVEAIGQVFASFSKSPDRIGPADQRVLVQTFVASVVLAGVITTLDAHRIPYITVEYDDWSGRTNSVTRGLLSSRVVFSPGGDAVPARWTTVFEATKAIQSHLGVDDLVVEFAVDKSNRLHIFQAWDRGRAPALTTSHLHDQLERLELELVELRAVRTELTLSDMADWNPAEMLGARPGTLDISLYRRLLTDRSWSEARRDLGYFFCRDPLLVEVGDHPYIDVERSLLSLTPETLSTETRSKYVAACIAQLEARPALHDKVEQDVAITYWPYCGNEVLRERLASRLTVAEITELSNSFRKATSELVSQLPRLFDDVAHSADVLREWRARNPVSNIDIESERVAAYLDEALEVCRAFGAVPFAKVARIAFIAAGLIKEITADGHSTAEDEGRRFWRSVSTPADALLADLSASLPHADIVEKYGHLRPHAYNIESLPYRLRSDFLGQLRIGHSRESRNFRNEPLPRIEAALASYCSTELGLGREDGLTSALLIEAISMREWHKFAFTSLLGDVLELVAATAEHVGASRSDARQLPIERILETLRSGLPAFKDALTGQGEGVRPRLTYPDFVGPEGSFFTVASAIAEPTFITDRAIEGPALLLTEADTDPSLIDHKIVLIEAADPGYDWIFSRPFSGLITCYGGTSSHMAIRCQELGIPAAIGCGPARFAQLREFVAVSLDCRNGLLAPGGAIWRT